MNPLIDLIAGIALSILLIWWIGNIDFFKRSSFSITSLKIAFALKVIIGFALFLVYSFHYTTRAEADTFRYFDDSAILFNSIKSEPLDFLQMISGIGIENDYFNTHYFSKMNNWYRSYENGLINDNRLVIRINAVIRIISFGSYHVHSVLFNFFAFIGAFELAKLFFLICKSKWKSYLAAFLIPSFVFWSSGILKETLLIGFLGVFCYRSYLTWHKQCNLRNILLLTCCFFFLFILKVYVLLAFLPIMVWWSIKKIISNWLISLSISFAVFFAIVDLTPRVFPDFNPLHILVQKQHDFVNLAEAFQAKSKIVIPRMEETYISVLSSAPLGLLNTMWRPFPADVNSFLVLLPFMENLLLLFCIIGALYSRNRLDKKQLDFMVASLFFVFSLFIIIGVSTPVIGAIVRYKIPGLPFVFIIPLLFIDSKKVPLYIRNNRIITWLHSHL